MTQPKVIITELDGALGVLPPSSGRLLAVVGVSSTGPLNTPATFARVRDLVSNFGSGPLVEAAAHRIERYGAPVVVVRTGNTVAGTVSAITKSGTGTATCVIATSPAAAPVDDYELVFKVVTGGTLGVAGVTYQVSLDGGRNFDPVQSLGVADIVAIGTSGVSFDFNTGTFVAGDTFKATTTAPQWNGSEMTAALDALKVTAIDWELVHIVGAIDATTFDNLETAIAGMMAAGRARAWIGNTRIPSAGETEAAYASALGALSAAKASTYGSLYSGACKATSSVSGRSYRRPVAFATAALEASVTEDVNIADVNLGPLAGVSIRDVNGNPDEHDESINPGLDDLRFGTLRTWDGYAGVYVNRPRLFSPNGSDFQLMPHRRVMNLAHSTLRAYFVRRLNKAVIVSRSTGFITEAEAIEIELAATALLRSVLLAKPKASHVLFTLSRTDNVLSTKTLTGQARVVPLAYPETIALDVGFYNPALAVKTL